MKIIFDENLTSAPRKGKARSFTFYLDKLKEMELEFDKLEALKENGKKGGRPKKLT